MPLTPAVWERPPYRLEAYFRPNAERQEALKPELAELLHATFLNHAGYDAEHLPEFLGSDIFLRVTDEKGLAGIFTADLVRTADQPVLHLTVGLTTPRARSGGGLMGLCMGLCLDLAAQAFATEEFYVALRTANPRVVARLWQTPWVRFHPRGDGEPEPPGLAALRPRFCPQVFGADRCDLAGVIFYDIYPIPPWEGRVPWHHDPAVNDFCLHHLRPAGRDAFLFLGPTRPPLPGETRGALAWPLGPR
ncbi:MAG: hypothetical protein KQJ78_06725 [Deltaproteobacteria bacterium]|nr:hypothetical protein [Deltaproteobacteria bacterium]